MKWTAWRVWLHPFRACRRLEEADKVENDLQTRLDDALQLLEKQRKETSIQTFQAAELSRQLAETEKELTARHHEHEETRLQLMRALDSLAEHKSVDEKLREFDKELSKVEGMKRSYEKRITELESRLASARKRLSQADDNELVEPIDMTDTRRFPVGPSKSRNNAMAPRPVTAHQAIPRPSFINRSSSSPDNNPSTPVSSHPDAATSPDARISSEQSENAQPSNENREAEKIEGTPVETAQKVAAYLNSLQSKDARKKRAGRAYDDWLSELPEL